MHHHPFAALLLPVLSLLSSLLQQVSGKGAGPIQPLAARIPFMAPSTRLLTDFERE
jgi:hypothetical protein